MYKRFFIMLNKGTITIENTGKIFLTLQNLEEGKHSLFLDNSLIKNLYTSNGKISEKIKTDEIIDNFYNVYVKKGDIVISEGVIKERLVEEEPVIIEEPIIIEEKPEIKVTENKIDLLSTNREVSPFRTQKKPYKWVKINIHELIYLPIEIWPFSRDEYILSCYRRYKHFILGNLGEDYILGVPDRYKQKNKLFMNKRGFIQFKPAEGQVLEHASGYWLKSIIYKT